MGVGIGSAEIFYVRLKEQGSAPATPASGYAQFYITTDPLLALKDDAGNAITFASALAQLSDVLSAAQTANFVLAAGDGASGGTYRGRALVAADLATALAEPPEIGGTSTDDIYATLLGLGSSSTSYCWIKYKDSTVSSMSGATATIDLNIPANSVILGVSMNVEAAIADDGGDDTWSSEFNDGGTVVAIESGSAPAQNTKVIKPFTQVTDAETDIVLTPNGGSFTSGSVRVVVAWFQIDQLPNA
jgi:hypothetical protein